MMPTDSLLEMVCMAGACSVVFAATGLLFAWRSTTLPVKHGILATSLTACLVAPFAIVIGWTADLGQLPARLILPNDLPAIANSVALDPTLVATENTVSPSVHQCSRLDMEQLIQDPWPNLSNNDLPKASPTNAIAENRIESAMESGVPRVLVSTQPPSGSIFSRINWAQFKRLAAIGFLVIWVTGTMIGIIVQLRGWLRVKRFLRHCCESDDMEWNRLVSECVSRLGLKKTPELLVSSAVSFPAVTGWRAPKLIVPVSFVGMDSISNLETIVSHELAHIKRNDQQTVLLQIAAATLYWWNPLIHRICSRLACVREMICDDIAVRETGLWEQYAHAIVAVAENAVQPQTKMALAMSAGDLELRLKRLLSRRGQDSPTKMNLWTTAVLFVVGVLGTCSLAFAQSRIETDANRDSITEQKTTIIQDTQTAADSESEFTKPALTTQAEGTDESNSPDEPVVLGPKSKPLCKMEGAVLGSDGKPVPNALIEVINSRKVVGQMTADSNGKFKFLFNSNVLGWGTVVAKSPDGLTQATASPPFFNKRPAETTKLKLVLAPLRSYSIDVVDDEGSPIEDVNVFAFTARHGIVRYGGKSDALGNIKIKIPETETIDRVVAFHQELGLDYKSYRVPSDKENQFVESSAFPAEGSETLVLGDTAPFTAIVVDENDQPLEDASVHPWLLKKPGCESFNLSDIHDLTRQKTDSSGKTIFKWFPEWQTEAVTVWPGKSGYYNVRGLYVPGNGRRATTIKLKQLTKISGRLVDQLGKPVEGARVEADGKKCHEQHCFGFTDKDGRYRFFTPADQTIILSVRERSSDQHRRISSFAKVYVSSADKPVTDCDLQLVKPVKIRGKIVNVSTGKLVSGNRMSLSRFAMSVSEYDKNVAADESWNVANYRQPGAWSSVPSVWGGGVDTDTGEFEMLLAPGVYMLRANDDDEPQLFVIEAVEEMEIVLDTKTGAKETVTGSVKVKRTSVPDATIVAVNKRFRGDRWEATANKDGQYSVNIREEPGMIVAFSKDKKLAAAFEFEKLTSVVDLELAAVATIRGRLLDSSSKPIAESEVYFGSSVYKPEYGGLAVTDQHGNFEIPHVCPRLGITLSALNPENGRRQTLVKGLLLNPGEEINVGDLKLKSIEFKRWRRDGF